MKALTLTQPWASAVAAGLKRVETRSSRTHYRGPIAIHAAAGFPQAARDFAQEEGFGLDLPLGAVIATARIVACIPTERAAPNYDAMELSLGDYTPGRWAWLLSDVRPLPEPIPAKGALGFWNWEFPGEVGHGADEAALRRAQPEAGEDADEEAVRAAAPAPDGAAAAPGSVGGR